MTKKQNTQKKWIIKTKGDEYISPNYLITHNLNSALKFHTKKEAEKNINSKNLEFNLMQNLIISKCL